MSKKQVETLNGEIFEVDTSDEACGKFGFRHGDKIVVTIAGGGKGVVEGVAPATEGIDPEPEVLWFALDKDDGDVRYCHPLDPGDLIPA